MQGTMAITMKAALFRTHGSPEVLEVCEVTTPSPGPGEALVAVRAVALNHIDLWLRRGLPTLKIPLPHVSGGDVCGVLAALGPGAQPGPHQIREGDRVVVHPGLSCGQCARCQAGQDNLCASFNMVGEHTWGGEAEFMVVPAANLVAAPEGPSDESLAAVPVAYLTAWQMLVDKARVQPGETVLVMAVGSGVGIAALQIAKHLGARVIAAASSDSKLSRARTLGADDILNYGGDADLREGIKHLAGKRGVDVVVDHAGGAHFPILVQACGKGGRVVTCGATAGHQATLDLRYVFWRQISVLGSTLAPRSRLRPILELVAQGRLQPVIDRTLPLERIGEGHRILEERAVFGKVVLRVA
jgi:NADPH:quinone reductase-like Zn-dependent oxidoreductase